MIDTYSFMVMASNMLSSVIKDMPPNDHFKHYDYHWMWIIKRRICMRNIL